MKNFSPTVKNLLINAVNQAKEYDDNRFKPEHILLSIILQEDNLVIKIFNKTRLDVDLLFEKLKIHLTNNIINSNRGIYSNNEILPSNETKFIISEMQEECKRMDDEIVDETHLLLALLKTNCEAQKMLVNLNLNYKKFKLNVMQYKKEDKNPTNESFDSPDDFSDNSSLDPNANKRTASRRPAKPNATRTPALDGFCTDITKAASENRIDPVVGREDEIKRVITILSRRRKNNPVLIGEPGVGKSAIVDGLAIMIANGEVSKALLGKKIYLLDLASIVAGTKYRGQFEERMKVILEELKNNPEIILFIDELHTIVGAGNASGSLDASNILKPALARGEIQCIGATTLDEYREHIEEDNALKRRFQEVMVVEPNLKETVTILNNIKFNYEKFHRVSYSNDIIELIVKLSDRYIADRAMPDKAIDILDEVGASTNIDVTLPNEIKELKEKITQLNTEKMEIVRKQKYEEAASVRDECKRLMDVLDVKMVEWETKHNKLNTEITPFMVEKTISVATGIPVTKVTSVESNNLKNLEVDIKTTVIGQDEAVKKISKAIRRSRLGIRNGKKPIGSFIFLGPTGVGKTYLAKILAKTVFGDENSLIRVDMSEYMEKFSMSQLIGAPRGYVGHGEGGKLTEAVRRNPYSVVLFDEIEKAHDDIFNLLLQLLDEGHLTDTNDRKVDFKNTLIIMTSNIGVKELSQFGAGIGYQTKNAIINEDERAKNIIQKALKDKFKPEFLNRIDETIIFNSLHIEDINRIIYTEIDEVKERLKELKYNLEVSKSAIDFIAKEGYHKEYGARPLKRAIQKYIEDPVTDEVMDNNLTEGDTIKISYSTKDAITTKVTKKITK